MVKLRLKRCGRKQRCSIPKRRKRSSESGFLRSDKESNLFLILMFPIFYISLKKVPNLQELFMIFQRRQAFFRNFVLIKRNISPSKLMTNENE
uniref:30S ribosomal protein S16, chloroplastic n=1 Tax=Stephania kwangsiensis TaxID=1501466 RepID=A0A6M3QI05_9MAGN|nr:ribosomal protein S16 [Stephania kwangsiensis]QJC59651.1 ribosomal protein S16 [Stephania kwangsiensis]